MDARYYIVYDTYRGHIYSVNYPSMHSTVDLGELTHTRVPCGMSKLLPPMNQCTS